MEASGAGGIGSLYKSVDLGKSWKSLMHIDGYSGSEPNLIESITSDSLFISGTYSAWSGRFLYKNFNSIWTWDKLTISITDMHFFNSKRGVATVDDGLYRTTDGGVTFLRDPAFAGIMLLSLDFVSPIIGYMISQDKCYKTTDGGFTWNLIYTAAQKLNKVKFLDVQNGYLIGDAILKTTDGGTTWSIVYDKDAVIDIDPVNEQLVFAVTKAGDIIRSKDGGVIWSVNVRSGTYGISYTHIEFNDEKNGVAAGRFESTKTGRIIYISRTFSGGN
jgi:hypothetical protein